MSTEIKHVLVAGPSGDLGKPIVAALQSASYPITLLTTNPNKTATSFPDLQSIQADYTSTTSLSNLLTSLPTPPSQTALVILLNRNQPDPQIKLLDAAAAAGIAHIIPSSFGYGLPDNEYLRDFPPLEGKNKMEDHVAILGNQGKLSYTCIQTSAFLDWALDRGLYANLINADSPFGSKGATMVFDGGDAKFSGTLLADIGKAVAGVLRDPTFYRNRNVHIHSAVISQNQLLRYARELAPEREFPTVDADTAQLEQAARKKLEAGESGLQVMGMMMPRPTFGLGLGLFQRVENEKLGIEVLGEKEVRELVRSYLER